MKRFPAMEKKETFLAIDEWAYTGTPINLKLALSYAMVLHEMFRHTRFLKMSAFTFSVSCLNIGPAEASYNTNSLLFKLYREHFGVLPVEVTGNSPQPAPKWPVAVVNPAESTQQLTLAIEGFAANGNARLWRLTGGHLDAARTLLEKSLRSPSSPSIFRRRMARFI